MASTHPLNGVLGHLRDHFSEGRGSTARIAFGEPELSLLVLFFAVADKGRARIFGRVSTGRFFIGKRQPLVLQGVVVPPFFAGDIASLFIRPFWNFDLRG